MSKVIMKAQESGYLFVADNSKRFILLAAVLFTGVISILGSGSIPTNNSDGSKVGGATITIWEEADSYAAKGEFYQAWYMITRTPPGMEPKTKEYLKNNNKIYDAGKNYFNASNLKNKKTDGYGNKFIYEQLDDFERFAKPQDMKWAKNNVRNLYGKRGEKSQSPKTQTVNTGTSQSKAETVSPKASEPQLQYAQAKAQCDYEVEVAVPIDNTQRNFRSFGERFVDALGKDLDRRSRKRDLHQYCMAAKGF
ncbi:MAG: hypothetical protein IPN92_06140 [Chromatiaceae bacterium]|nr:hypothetical protein [Chromatiaceae bacterium]